jgi:hypothetical protein
MNGKTLLLAHLQPHLESLDLSGSAKLINTELNHLAPALVRLQSPKHSYEH